MYIADIRAFLTVAKQSGYKLQGNYCVKERIRDADSSVLIKIDLITGEITVKCLISNDKCEVAVDLDINEFFYWIKDIDYLVKLDSLYPKQRILNKGEKYGLYYHRQRKNY